MKLSRSRKPAHCVFYCPCPTATRSTLAVSSFDSLEEFPHEHMTQLLLPVQQLHMFNLGLRASTAHRPLPILRCHLANLTWGRRSTACHERKRERERLSGTILRIGGVYQTQGGTKVSVAKWLAAIAASVPETGNKGRSKALFNGCREMYLRPNEKCTLEDFEVTETLLGRRSRSNGTSPKVSV
jgi:hypothetical protein